MVRQGFRTGWMAALLALAIAVFAIAPAVEAATCGLEPAAAHSVSADDHGPAGDIDGKSHAPCNHGHCHHGGSVLRTGDVAALAPSLSGDAPMWRADDVLLSRIPGGLERPPRS